MLNHNIFSILFYSIPFSTPNLIIHGLEASSLVPSVLDYYLGGGSGIVMIIRYFFHFLHLRMILTLAMKEKNQPHSKWWLHDAVMTREPSPNLFTSYILRRLGENKQYCALLLALAMKETYFILKNSAPQFCIIWSKIPHHKYFTNTCTVSNVNKEKINTDHQALL